MPRTRREFIQGTAAAVGFGAVHSVMASAAQPAGTAGPADGILSLRLGTSRLDALRRFYGETLGMGIAASSKDSITVAAGRTKLTFVAAKAGAPYYHFAFNIPENKLVASKAWLRGRAALVKRGDGSDEYHFASWNAHSVYFLDPAGNILEFIARHNLRNAAEGAFSTADVLYASEIGVVVDDVAAAARAAKADLGLDTFPTAGMAAGEQFAAVGDDHRLLIVVKRGRRWLGAEDKSARVFATEAVLRGSVGGAMKVGDHPYKITSEKA